MSLERLLTERIIEKTKKDSRQAKKKMSLARRDLKTARNNFMNKNFDWALAIAYNAMLQAGRALMFSEGYRPIGRYEHVGVMRFLHERFKSELTDRLVYFLDKTRRKRHRVVYDEEGIISAGEAETAINLAKEFLDKAEDILSPSR